MPGIWSWGGVKTHEARTVRLPRSIAEELGGYLVDRPHGPEDLVFTRAAWVARCASRSSSPTLLQAPPHAIAHSTRADPTAARGLRLYDLRHTAASLMIRQGASVKAVQKQLGHATASITLDTYGHLFPDELDALAGRLEDARAEALASGPWQADPARTRRSCPFGKVLVSERCRGAGGGARTLMPDGPNAFKARLSADSSTPALTCPG